MKRFFRGSFIPDLPGFFEPLENTCFHRDAWWVWSEVKNWYIGVFRFEGFGVSFIEVFTFNQYIIISLCLSTICRVEKQSRGVEQASQNVQSTSVRDRFWKFRSGKIARRCGAKHICKWKCEKLTGTDHFLEIWCQKIAGRCGAKHICRSKCSKNLRFAAFWDVSNWLDN